MPRRKQQAPKRAAAYDPEDVKEAAVQTECTNSTDCSLSIKKRLGENDLGEAVKDVHQLTQNKLLGENDLGKDFKRPDLSTKEKLPDETDSREGFKSPVYKQSPTIEPSGHDVDSESNDPISDDESTPVKSEDDGTKSTPDSLEQIKTIYKSFLNNPYWSFLSLNSSQREADEQLASSSGSSSSNSSPGRNCYDWHQAAITKTLSQDSQKRPVPLEPNIFSTVQLYRQSTKLYGSIFTGASKFHCKSCSAAYDTLLDLTVHMNETDHYRDDNLESGSKGAKSWSKPRKRSLLEMEGKEDAQKVLRCMYCGNSFESLQDLSVHMIKTKHYQKVPLREPRTALAAKVVSSFRKRLPVELEVTTDQTKMLNIGKTSESFKVHHEEINKDDLGQKTSTSGVHSRSQNFKCMECGISHDSLQQLSVHVMLTGHFVKVTQPMQKRSQPLESRSKSEKSPCPSPLSTTAVAESLPFISVEIGDGKIIAQKVKETTESRSENEVPLTKSTYLTEDDLKESPTMDFDILKSLENTVTSAISKAQRGAPSWGGYQSIHAAYQLQNQLKPALSHSGIISALKQASSVLESQSVDKSHLISLSSSSMLQVSEVKLQKKEKAAAADRQFKDLNEKGSPHQQLVDLSEMSPSISPKPDSMVSGCKTEENEMLKNKPDPTAISNLYDESGLLSPQPEPKQPSVSPLSALQSVMNLHLGKAAKPVKAIQDPMSMLLRMSNSMAERAALPGPSGHSAKVNQLCYEITHNCRDQPIDLSKGKNEQILRAAALPGKALSSSLSRTSVGPKIFTPLSPLRENALSDISDMLRNLSDTEVSNPSIRSCKPEQGEIEGSHTSDDAEDSSVVHKRKGRQSHWKPQHLLILQAQFTSCLRQTADGKFMISDLNSQERMVISHITGLSMTTISHWLANVKYQLRRTGRTKFIKNVDTGHPVFYCSECAMQYQARSTYICHLESHLGFKIKDLTKISSKDFNTKLIRRDKSISLKPVPHAVLPARGSQEKRSSVTAL
ncbi:hypothetical protein DNTS_009260 [Danionella cerebrum]|uniref:C2H2-type domain-containing protein n=1 Tax=Danionella cerebrum TaxID=2873325 RepID=A0A553Q5L7_9TELE|nr:hypothetical protein DNTS_009260 [Danionella translucida]